MDQEKKERLKKQRMLLQKEVRLKELRKRISIQLEYLDDQKYDYQIYYENEHLDWISSHMPLRKRDAYNGLHDYQIDDGSPSPNCPSIHCDSDDLFVDKIREQFLLLLKKDNLLSICYDGGDPEIEIRVEALVSQPLTFFSNPETWVLTKDKSWIIEYIWNQKEIRFFQIQNRKPVLIKKIIAPDG